MHACATHLGGLALWYRTGRQRKAQVPAFGTRERDGVFLVRNSCAWENRGIIRKQVPSFLPDFVIRFELHSQYNICTPREYTEVKDNAAAAREANQIGDTWTCRAYHYSQAYNGNPAGDLKQTLSRGLTNISKCPFCKERGYTRYDLALYGRGGKAFDFFSATGRRRDPREEQAFNQPLLLPTPKQFLLEFPI